MVRRPVITFKSNYSHTSYRLWYAPRMEPLLNRLHLRQFRLIEAIVRTGQLSLAADRLGITQPAASRTLADVERLVGEPLFERRAKGLVATPIGTVFARHATTLISALDKTVTDLEAFRSGEAGTVRIGTVTGPAVAYVVPAIQKLKAEAPRCEISITVAPSVELMDGLLNGDFDFVLGRVPPDVDPRQLEISRGRVEEIHMMTRIGHPLLGQRALGFAALGGLTWIIQRTGMPLRDAIEQAFINRGLPVPRDTIDTASLLVTIAYLKNTDAIAAMTAEVVGLLRDVEAGGLGTLDMRESVILAPYNVIRRRHQTMTPICERMLDLIGAELAIV